VRDAELVCAYWTTSGPVTAENGWDWSVFDFADRCAAAQRAGFAGVGIWHTDLQHILERRTLCEIKQILDANGLSHLELEAVGDWVFDEGSQRRKDSDVVRRRLFDAAAVLDAHHIKVYGGIPATRCPLGKLTESFAELCAHAAQQHDALIAYEMMPFDLNVRTVDDAIGLVGGAAAANGAIVLDTWHLEQLHIAPEALRALPPQLLGWVELSDGRREHAADLWDETINHRRLPGEGEFAIGAYVDACRAVGYAGPWGVEVLAEELRSLPLDEVCERSYATTAAQLARARGD
jgi:sugar phosphate isomerase/epimerase